jgi:hypothetical protein
MKLKKIGMVKKLDIFKTKTTEKKTYSFKKIEKVFQKK